MTFTGINPQFATKSDRLGQQYPAVQVTAYKPQTLEEKIDLCLSENSLDLLADDTFLQTEVIECIYNRDKVLMHKITSDVRWIFLSIPPIFAQDKDTKEVSFLKKGSKLYENNQVTIAKCFLACLVGSELVLDIEGKPQVFTLKLNSNKTQLIGNSNQSTEEKTIYSLNRGIQKHFKTKDNLVHLVSVALNAVPNEFVSNRSGDSSLGVMYRLVGNAKPLTSSQQQQIFDLVSHKDLREMMNNPFDLKLSELAVIEPQLEDEDIDF